MNKYAKNMEGGGEKKGGKGGTIRGDRRKKKGGLYISPHPLVFA